MKLTKKQFAKIEEELCRRVNLPYPPPEGKRYDVSKDANWTEAEEADFKQWLIAYLRATPAFKRMSKKSIENWAGWIVFDLGWRICAGVGICIGSQATSTLTIRT